MNCATAGPSEVHKSRDVAGILSLPSAAHEGFLSLCAANTAGQRSREREESWRKKKNGNKKEYLLEARHRGDHDPGLPDWQKQRSMPCRCYCCAPVLVAEAAAAVRVQLTTVAGRRTLLRVGSAPVTNGVASLLLGDPPGPPTALS